MFYSYSILFEKFNCVYVGVSRNPIARLSSHLSLSSSKPVSKLSEYENPIVGVHKISESPEIELETYLEFKGNGYTMLNTRQPGKDVGIRWDDLSVLNASNLCVNMHEFKHRFNGAYAYAKRNKCQIKDFKKEKQPRIGGRFTSGNTTYCNTNGKKHSEYKTDMAAIYSKLEECKKLDPSEVKLPRKILVDCGVFEKIKILDNCKNVGLSHDVQQ